MCPRSSSAPEHFDPLSDTFAADPYRAYDALRELTEPPFHPALDAYLLASYADVDAAARSPDMVRTRDGFAPPQALARERQKAREEMPNHARYVQFSLLDSDGAVHRRLRKLLLGQFSRHAVQRYRPLMESYLATRLDQALQQRQFDFIAQIASQVPGHIIGHVLGVPVAERGQLRLWTQDIVQFFDVGRGPDDQAKAERATAEFAQYLQQLIALRRRRPDEHLLSMLVSAQGRGELDETELISTCMLVLMAGHGSTIDALGTGMLALLHHPDAWEKLRQQPALMAQAVQEMFRYESPLPYFHRYARTPVRIGGRDYPAGTRFGLLYGAANRDPAQFDAPDRFNVERSPNRHVAFGRGAHLCLGNNLSRLDMEIFFTLLLERVAHAERTQDQLRFKPGITERGLLALEMTVQPR